MISLFTEYPIIVIILFILLGAWTGYITNDMAIKMLFKEYGFGKFKFGGVIVKTRKKLEDSISELVEKEIINHKTIKQQLDKEEVKTAITELVNDFFESILFKYISDAKLSEIDGLEETIEKSLNMIESYLRDNLVYTFISVVKNIDVNDLFTEKQIIDFSYSFVEELTSFIRKKSIIRALLNSFYRENGDILLDRLLTKGATKKIISNFDSIFADIWENIYKKYHRQINVFIKKLMNDLDLKSFVHKIEKALYDKTLDEFINAHSLEYLSKQLESYLDKDHSKITFANLFNGTLKALKQIDKPVSSLFSENVKTYITNLIKEQLPSIIKGVVELINDNREDFETIIEKLVDETIKEKKAVKRTILVAIRKYLLENITEKYGIINKVINKLENMDINVISENLTNQVIAHLSEKKISEMIIELEENEAIDLENIGAKAYQTITYIFKNNSNIISKIDLSNVKIGQLFSFDLYALLESNIENVLIKELFENERISKPIRSFLTNKLTKVLNYPLNFFINKKTFDSIAIKAQILVENYLKDNVLEVKSLVNNFLQKELENKNIAELIREDKINQTSINAIIDVIMKTFRTMIFKQSELSTHKILDSFNKSPHMKQNIVKMILDFMGNGMGKIIEGKISGVVRNNLQRLDDEEVLLMMQDFMGRRLKPLTILGAVLGGITGIGLGIGVVNTGITLEWYQILGIAIPVYGLLGFMTNVMAIFFIFRPYKPLFGIQQAQGIISKQIPMFAKSMGKMLTEHLVTDDSIKRILNENEEKVKNYFNDNLKKDDLKILREYMLDNTNLITSVLSSFTVKYMKKNSENLNNQLISSVENFELSKIDSADFSQMILENLLRKIDEKKFALVNPILDIIKSNKTFREIYEELFNIEIDKLIANFIEKQINTIVNDENEDTLLMMFYKLDKVFDNYFEKTLSEIIDFSDVEKISNFLTVTISKNLLNGKNKMTVIEFLIKKIQEIQNTNLVEDLFEGKVFNYITQKITNYSIHYEEKIILWIKSSENQLFETISKQVKSDIGFIQKIGYSAIDGDTLIKNVLSKMINKEMPIFIHNKMNFFTDIIKEQLDILGKREVGEFDVSIDFDNIFLQLQNAIQKEDFKKHLNITIDINKDLIKNATLNDCIRIVDIHSIYDLMVRFDKELKYINKELKTLLLENKEMISKDLSIIGSQIITKDFMRYRISDLTDSINKDDVENLIFNVYEVFEDNNYLAYETFEVVEAIFSHFNNFKISEIININYLKTDIGNVIIKLQESENFNQTLTSMMYNLTSFVTDDLNSMFEEKFLNYIFSASGNVLYATTQEHFLKLISAIDFREIAERQILLMEPKQIKELFDTFASKYFRKLERYGFIGGLFAIDFITLVSFIIYSVMNLKNKKTPKDI